MTDASNRTTPSAQGKTGLCLVEVVLAAALVAVIVAGLMDAATGGGRGAALATRTQMASLLVSRIADRTVGVGYVGLANLLPQSGESVESELDLGSLAPDEEAGLNPHVLVVDGLSFSARLRTERVVDGLIRLTIRLAFRPGKTSSPSPEPSAGTLTAVRYVCDPMRTSPR